MPLDASPRRRSGPGLAATSPEGGRGQAEATPAEEIEEGGGGQAEATPAEEIEEIYRGRPSHWAAAGWYAAGVLTIWIYGLGLVFILAGYLTVINRFWTITPAGVTLRTGILGRTEKTILMSRVRDVGFHQGVLDRATGVGSILLASSDPSDPIFVIKGLHDAGAVYRSLEDCLPHTKGSELPIER